MTCIVGVEFEDGVIIGADSLGNDGTVAASYPRNKVFYVDTLLFGCSGSYRQLDLIEYRLQPPQHKPGMPDDIYIRILLLDALNKIYKDYGYMQNNSNVDSCSGFALVGYNGKIYNIQSDLSVIEIPKVGTAIGSGYAPAIGSLLTTYDMNIKAFDRVAYALRTSAASSPGVGPPFHIYYLRNDSDEEEYVVLEE